VSVTRLSVGFY